MPTKPSCLYCVADFTSILEKEATLSMADACGYLFELMDLFAPFDLLNSTFIYDFIIYTFSILGLTDFAFQTAKHALPVFIHTDIRIRITDLTIHNGNKISFTLLYSNHKSKPLT